MDCRGLGDVLKCFCDKIHPFECKSDRPPYFTQLSAGFMVNLVSWSYPPSDILFSLLNNIRSLHVWSGFVLENLIKSD